MLKRLYSQDKRVISYDRTNVLATFSITIILSIIPTVRTYIETQILNLLANHKGNIRYLMLFVGLLLIILLFREGISEYQEYRNQILSESIEKGLLLDVLNKISKIQYHYFEDSMSYDRMHRVIKKGAEYGASMIENTFSLIQILSSIVFLAIMVAKRSWLCCVLIILLEIPILFLSYSNGTMNYQASQEATEADRRSEYFSSMFYSKKSIYELSVFDCFQFWNKKWKEDFSKVRTIEMRGFQKYFIRIRFVIGINAVFLTIIFLILFVSMDYTTENISFAIAFIGNMSALFKKQTDELPYCLSEIVEGCKYEEDFKKFMAFDEIQMGEKREKQKICKIVCKDVRFHYPGSNHYVLDGISCSLDFDKNYAIVGTNGVGKTTLIKLLVGLFTEYEGSIKVDGREVREMQQCEFEDLYAVVFQDFARYATSVFDNIVFGREKSKSNIEKVIHCLKQVNIWDKVEKMPQKEFTELGKFTSGSVELSYGEWQKIAIARAMVKGARITILDEPTSALDPSMEYEIYQSMSKNFHKGTIMISHRLMSVKDVDEILVLDDGKIVQAGSHKELMNQDGRYREMYESQRKWYDEGYQIASGNCLSGV